MLLRPTFTAPLCATRLENRMERPGSRLAPNDGYAVDPYSISPHLGAVQGLLWGGRGVRTVNIILNRVHHGTSLCYPT